MSEPENFLSRWSRLKRETEAAPEAEKPAEAAAPPSAAPPVEEPAFDLTKLPSLEDIGASTDISMFMQSGVPAALRHAALRRAWASDPAIRDFRGLQENAWDFNAPDGVPGFGTFKSNEEIKALAQRLFGADGTADEPVPQTAPQDSGETQSAELRAVDAGRLDENQDMPAPADPHASERDDASASQQDDDSAMQRSISRRHGGALPQ
jgi:hypothetical protein